MKLKKHMLYLVGLVFFGCSGSIKSPCPIEANAISKSIYVVNHGWHTGIVIRREDISNQIWPENNDFPFAKYIEVGWGDAGFYQANEIKISLAIQALFWPTKSVLHVVGFNDSVERYFSASEIVEIKISQNSLDKLSNFIHKAYARDSNNRPIHLGQGLYGISSFYRAVENYHLFNTCNVWTARAIQSAGCPISPSFAFTAENVINQASQIGSKR